MEQEILEKWEPLLEGIKGKGRKTKFAKIYEKTTKENDKEHLKLLFSILFKLFNETKELKTSKSKKNEVLLLEFFEGDFYVDGNIIPEIMMQFIRNSVMMIKAKYESIEKFSHIKVKKEDYYFKLYYVY